MTNAWPPGLEMEDAAMEHEPRTLPSERSKEMSMAGRAQELAMAWHGFGSPVGLSILIVSVGVSAVLLRLALFGLD
jgi:hypothetical protein